MNISKITKFGIASLLAGFACGVAGADTNADLQARLAAAEARISELSSNTNSNWLNDTRSDEIRSLVHDVLADADSRASMLGDGSSVTVNVHGYVQSRWTYIILANLSFCLLSVWLHAPPLCLENAMPILPPVP